MRCISVLSEWSGSSKFVDRNQEAQRLQIIRIKILIKSNWIRRYAWLFVRSFSFLIVVGFAFTLLA